MSKAAKIYLYIYIYVGYHLSFFGKVWVERSMSLELRVVWFSEQDPKYE